jgi:hypothetical protein
MFPLRAIPSKANFQEDTVAADQEILNAILSFKDFTDRDAC